MGTIQIKKYERTVTVGKGSAERQKVKKTYGKIIYRGTLKLNDMAEHIMKHGSVYTEDVVIGVITKLKTCMQEMLADGYKVKLDGIGTLYPVLTSELLPRRPGQEVCLQGICHASGCASEHQPLRGAHGRERGRERQQRCIAGRQLSGQQRGQRQSER